ncbi:MAG: hypothetical protein CMK59_05665 [Proteobacteria bacterium]|nr:hypothetical protein [Pseudomonadota bacterium]
MSDKGKKRRSRLFQAQPSLLLIDERVRNLVLPVVSEHHFEDEEEDILEAEEAVLEEERSGNSWSDINEEAVEPIRLFVGVDQTNNTTDKETEESSVDSGADVSLLHGISSDEGRSNDGLSSGSEERGHRLVHLSEAALPIEDFVEVEERDSTKSEQVDLVELEIKISNGEDQDQQISNEDLSVAGLSVKAQSDQEMDLDKDSTSEAKDVSVQIKLGPSHPREDVDPADSSAKDEQSSTEQRFERTKDPSIENREEKAQESSIARFRLATLSTAQLPVEEDYHLGELLEPDLFDDTEDGFSEEITVNVRADNLRQELQAEEEGRSNTIKIMPVSPVEEWNEEWEDKWDEEWEEEWEDKWESPSDELWDFERYDFTEEVGEESDSEEQTQTNTPIIPLKMPDSSKLNPYAAVERIQAQEKKLSLEGQDTSAKSSKDRSSLEIPTLTGNQIHLGNDKQRRFPFVFIGVLIFILLVLFWWAA